MKKLLLSLLLGMMTLGAAAQSINGDVNGDGVVNISDVNRVINIILAGGYDSSADINNDGQVNITDLNVIIDIILNPTVEPPKDDWVDLGLPSGTIWATRNIGANSPEENGDYFAWGETEPKDYYEWNTYKWCNGSYETLTKYCTDAHDGYNGFTDYKTELEPADDAATANWGSGARMPSGEQAEELVNQCYWEWTQRNGVYGQLGTGPNGYTIFFPASGYRYTTSLSHAGTFGYCWTCTLEFDFTGTAFYLGFGEEDATCYRGYSAERCLGFPVRAVRVP